MMIHKNGMGLFCYPNPGGLDSETYQKHFKYMGIFCDSSSQNSLVMTNNAYERQREKKEFLKLSDCYLILSQPFRASPTLVKGQYKLNQLETTHIIGEIATKALLPFYFIRFNKDKN